MSVHEVQPRLCGEYANDVPMNGSVAGSTPPVRGIFIPFSRHRLRARFNPACAGNILLKMVGMCLIQVQPRLCGEYSGTYGTPRNSTGSTPPVRGIFNCNSMDYNGFRFNPACAGNIGCQSAECDRAEVQPRLCGEYANNLVRLVLQIGSTPPVRGISITILNRITQTRFNPACAGNMRCCSMFEKVIQVQPRLCGEYGVMSGMYLQMTGSTPPVRGILSGGDAKLAIKRFNPACAGNMKKKRHFSLLLQVQPRLCGEYEPQKHTAL